MKLFEQDCDGNRRTKCGDTATTIELEPFYRAIKQTLLFLLFSS